MVRRAFTLAALALSACATTASSPQVDTHTARRQWQAVESSSPLIAAAYLQSLVALSEDRPEEAARAREMAFALARQSGLIASQRQACAQCEWPRTEGEVPRYVGCLEQRLTCLRPR